VKTGELTSGATVDERGGGKPREPSRAKLSRGTNLGRYVVLDPIGEGGLGVVYSAYDPELDRKVAVKLLRPRATASATESEGKARLLREAQAMARLSHPNVVAIHDVGVHEDQVFIAMDLIEGETLTVWMRTAKRTAREVLDVFFQAGRGLAAAHAASLVHRDFKPDNVLVAKDGRALVTDFGLARAAGFSDPTDIPVSPDARTELGHDSGPLSTPLTAAGIVMGTPGYVAPEQLRGEPADALSDQFSFCVSLYEALYGERPFAGDTLDVYAAAIEHSGAHPRPLRGQVPAWLRKILTRGMSLRPADRFASIDLLLKELSKDAGRVRRRVLLGISALLACGTALLAVRQQQLRQAIECEDSSRHLDGVWDADARAKLHAAFTATGKPFAEDAWDGARRTLDRYAASWASMRNAACIDTRVHKEQTEEVLLLRMGCFEKERVGLQALVGVLTRAEGSVVQNAIAAAQSLESPNSCANLAALRIESAAIPADPARAARATAHRAQLAEATALTDASQYEKAIPIAAALAADCEATGERWVQSEALWLLGKSQRRSLEYKKASETFTEAYFAGVSSHNMFAASRAACGAMDSSAGLGKYDDARLWSRLAQTVIDEIGGNDELQSLLLTASSLTHLRRGEYSEAEADSRKAFDLRVRLYGPDDRRTIISLNNGAAAAMNQGQWQRALESFSQVVATTERVLGASHPELLVYLQNYGEILNALGRPREAYEASNRALNIAIQSSGPQSTTTAYALGYVAHSLRCAGEDDKSLATAMRGVKLYEDKGGSDSKGLADGLDELGLSWLAKGRPKEALDAFERAIAMHERVQGLDSEDLQSGLDGAGRAYVDLHQPRKAIPLLERAVRLRQKGAPAPGLLGVTLFALARAHADVKDNPRFARDLALQARDELAKYPWYESTVQQIDVWLKAHPVR
jgi:eukaryotic-like serine/threonine-protein kinase